MDPFKSINRGVDSLHRNSLVNPSRAAGWLKTGESDKAANLTGRLNANSKILFVSWISGVTRIGANALMAVANLVIAVVSPIFCQFATSRNAFLRLGGNFKQIGHGAMLSIPLINVIWMRSFNLHPEIQSPVSNQATENGLQSELEPSEEEEPLKILSSTPKTFEIDWSNKEDDILTRDPLIELLTFATGKLEVGVPEIGRDINYSKLYAVSMEKNNTNISLDEVPRVPEDLDSQDELFSFLAGDSSNFVYIPGQVVRDLTPSPWFWDNESSMEQGVSKFYEKLTEIVPPSDTRKRVVLLALMSCAQTFEVHIDFIAYFNHFSSIGVTPTPGMGRRFQFEIKDNKLIGYVTTLYDVKIRGENVKLNKNDPQPLEMATVIAKYEVKRGFQIDLETIKIEPLSGTINRLPQDNDTAE